MGDRAIYILRRLERWIGLPPDASQSDKLRIRLICITCLCFLAMDVICFLGAFWAFGGLVKQHAIIAISFVGKCYLIPLLRFSRNPALLGWAFATSSIIGIWLSTWVDHFGRIGAFEIGAAYTPFMIVSLVFVSLIGTRRSTLYFSALCLATLVGYFLIGSIYVYEGGVTPHGKLGLVLRCTAIILTATMMLPVSRIIYATLEDLEQARNRARAAELMKADFLSTMSHEIRTPLGGIISISDMLARSDLPETERNYANILQRGSHSLMEIINDILDMAKLEKGRVEIAQDEFSPKQLLDDVVALFETKAANENLWIGADAHGLPDTLIGDAPHLRQILNNLVSNAIKFTKEGGVRIGGRLIQMDQGHAIVQFYVQDSGYGISEEDQTKLFQRFEQTESAKITTQSGSGLGLSICQDMAELMGGTIALQSAIGKGSTFHFTLRFPVVAEERDLQDAA